MENPIIYDRIDKLEAELQSIKNQVALIYDGTRQNMERGPITFIAREDMATTTSRTIVNVTGKGVLKYAFTHITTANNTQVNLIVSVDGKSYTFPASIGSSSITHTAASGFISTETSTLAYSYGDGFRVLLHGDVNASIRTPSTEIYALQKLNKNATSLKRGQLYVTETGIPFHSGLQISVTISGPGDNVDVFAEYVLED